MAEAQYTIPIAVQSLIRGSERDRAQKEEFVNQPKFRVTEAISRVAFIYEKIRNAVDYKEEHLLVKNAIIRVLRRRFLPGSDPVAVAHPLVTELIRGGYLRNDTTPEVILDEVARTLTKYARFLNKAIPSLSGRRREEIFSWCLVMLACELEEVLSASHHKRAMVEFVYATMLERVDVMSKQVTEDERKVQIYTAVLRSYLQYDEDLTTYELLKFFYPEWREGKEETLNRVARNVSNIHSSLTAQIHHPLQERLVRQFKRVNILFIIFSDWLKQSPDPLATLQHPNQLASAIEEAANEKYKQVKIKLRRASLRSIIYVFITKMLLALLLEIPYDYFFIGHLNYVPITINAVFHPLLLFAIALAVHIPTRENTEKIVEGIKDLVYRYEGKTIVYQIRPKIRRNWLLITLFRILYLLTFVITFGGLIAILVSLHFNWLGMTLFVVFLTVVSFFGLRVRQLAKDLVVIDRRDNFLNVIIDFFTIPIVRAGRWLSVNFAKVNVFVFILDVIIEAPFKIIVDVVEDWFAYIREKREEIYD